MKFLGLSNESGDLLLSGGSPYVGEFGEGCGPVLGCTDETALNYNQATEMTVRVSTFSGMYRPSCIKL